MTLSKSELGLLDWLSGPGLGRRSECPTIPLLSLLTKRLARINGGGWVHITELGRKTLAETLKSKEED